MHQFRLAVATRCLSLPFTAAIQSVAEMNVSGLQFDLRNEVRASDLSETGRRDLLHVVSEYGLTVSGAVFPLNHPLYEPDKIDARVNAVRDALKFAYSLRAGTMCLRVGRIPEDLESKERKLLTEALCDLARYSNHVGTVLAITPTNDSADALLTLLNDVKTGPIGIDFDPAHFAMTGRPVAESLRALHELVLHVQLRDGTHGIDGGQETAVGQGNVDWVEVLALLGEMDYRGWLTSIRNQGDDRVRDISRGVKSVQRLLIGG
jgi:sugar phosphate isomerase/epimerase